MATKADLFKSETQRRGGKRRKARVSKKKPKKAAWSRKSGHAGTKATHAFENVAPGKRSSRESTRGSANRSKADAAMNVTEETRKGAPTNIARKAIVKRSRVRGGPAR